MAEFKITHSEELKAKEQELRQKIMAGVEAFEKETNITISSISLSSIERSTRVGIQIVARQIDFTYSL